MNESIYDKIFSYFNLKKEEEEFEIIHQTIESGITFRGTNLWVLIFAIIIASVGLNVNSTAVIIGAMLISPLMGPINGMGYSIATYDMPLFQRSVKNFTFAVIISLLTSTIYFFISPVSMARSELLARTSPSFYDILIALSGGMAGIIAVSSKNKGNVIPGVAIATALMPPLCTAGYGLANGKWMFTLGALYLFTINTVFIGISSIIISRILNFPIRTIPDPIRRKRINTWLTTIITITIIPSVYLGYLLVLNERFHEKASNYVNAISNFNESYLIKHEINELRKEITLIYGGHTLDENEKKFLINRKNDFQLQKATVKIQQGYLPENLSYESQESFLKNEIERLQSAFLKQEKMLDSVAQQTQMGSILLNEIHSLFPQIVSCSYAETYLYHTDGNKEKISFIIFYTLSQTSVKQIQEPVEKWLKARLNTNNFEVIFKTYSP